MTMYFIVIVLLYIEAIASSSSRACGKLCKSYPSWGGDLQALNSVSSGAYFVPSTSHSRICFQNSDPNCLSTLDPVSVDDLKPVVNSKRAVFGERLPPLSGSFIAGKNGKPRSSVPTTESRFMSGKFFTREMLDSRIESLIDLKMAGTTDIWNKLNGPRLLNLANDVIEMNLPEHNSAIKSIMILAPNVDDPPDLRDFCTRNAKSIENFLLSHHRHYDRVARIRSDYIVPKNLERAIFTHAFAHKWLSVCSFSLRVKNIVLLHALFVHTASSATRSSAVKFVVNRDSAFTDAIDALLGPEIRGQLVVKFDHESALGRGVVREWFTQAAKELEEFFLCTSPEPPYAVTSIGAEGEAMGRFVGLAVLHDAPIGLYFSVQFWAFLMDQKLDLKDIQVDQPDLFRSFTHILNADALDDDLEIEIGSSVVGLTLENRSELISRKINFYPVSPEEEEFKTGFLSVVPNGVSGKFFSPLDMQTIVFGNPNITFEDLERNLVLKHYEWESKQIGWLMRFLKISGNAKKFLLFVTGSDRLPIGNQLHRKIVLSHCDQDASHLPTSHTCTFETCLPQYESEAEFLEKMTLALNSDTAMFLV